MNEGQFARFLQGTETHAWRFMGCHREMKDGAAGYCFRVWAPNAGRVSVVGSFNGWNPEALPMQRMEGGIFEAFSADAKELDSYKFYIEKQNGGVLWKADPYGFYAQRAPETASRICSLSGYEWQDGSYRRSQARKKLMQNPVNIYEVHPASWKHREDGTGYGWQELTKTLLPYVRDMGYTHVELLPIGEYASDASWGYGTTGYYAPTARYGEPKDFMAFVDACHAAGIGVILDWVPSVFPKDAHGLIEFDGGDCYEVSDPVLKESPRRDVRYFDYERGPVRSFLLSNAVYWVEEFHLDGLRIGNTASILHRSFGRPVWNEALHGSGENPAGRAFLRLLNETLSGLRGNLLIAAEDASETVGITDEPSQDGLGFAAKWCTDWVEDQRRYLELDPVYRKFHHENLTFAMTYFGREQQLLPLSHDEVAHGNQSLIDRMPGYYDDKFANLRLLFGFQIAHPGKKLSFMGNEIGQFAPWDEKRSLDWFLLSYERHRQLQHWVQTLNRFYLQQRPLWHIDREEAGFRWIRADDSEHSVIAFRRIDRKGREVLVICNFCPVTWDHYRLGVPKKGCYLPSLCSDSPEFGGTGVYLSAVRSEPVPCDGLDQSAEFTLPPLSVTFYLQE